MTYKLKHISKYCCNPANELEFEAVKMAAEIGGVEVFSTDYIPKWIYLRLDDENELTWTNVIGGAEEIPVLDFCNKLRITEEEAEKLEDDRVAFGNGNKHKWAWSDDDKRFIALEGYYFKTNEDGTEVTLHKR